MKNIYSFSFFVKEEELDNLNHVNNINYVKWVQKASEKHWSFLTNNAFENSFVWVVLRHEIDYLASAVLGDKIEITTWVGDSYGVKSERFVEIFRNDTVIAKAKTIWCLLDKKNMKPIRIPKEILKILNEVKK
ncbi:thioesterase family protein [uncultured Lutibacter sp.]|uniref:acyl-CoA thioesterase n=1 Tax=uncultured Lutibacter sp. TaxID=437739 RepID=UPI002631FD6F|nr:thioesterase family protein [uncultured Lutibacter sp.]